MSSQRNRGGAAVVVVGAALIVGACSSVAPPRFHSLTPAPAAGTAAPGAAAKVSTAGALAWEVLPVGVPPGVDQPQWVVRSVDGSLLVLEQERWVGPLAEEVRAAVTAQLTQALGASAAKATPTWRVRIDVLRFEAAPGREARIDASWSLVGDAAGVALRCRGEFAQVPAADGYLALAASLQKAVSRLADAVAPGLQAIAAGRTPACEG